MDLITKPNPHMSQHRSKPRALVARLAIVGCLPLFLMSGCTGVNANGNATIYNANPILITAGGVEIDGQAGVMTATGIHVEATGGTVITSCTGTVFYDHDGDQTFSEGDGVLIAIENTIPNTEGVVDLGAVTVHTGPGIGAPMITVNVTTADGEVTVTSGIPDPG